VNVTHSGSLIPVSFEGADRESQPFQHSRRVSGALSDIVTRLRAAIEAAGLWVLHEIDPQAILARGGYVIAPARQILFFHPSLMVRLLAADSSALLEVPLKFALTQAGGGQVMVRWSDPIAAFARYGDEPLSQLGRDLAKTTDRIVGVQSA
jgi:uncharacterized protein (DUF302 family)